MNDKKTLDLMRKIIEEKKQKSASQSGIQRSQQSIGEARVAIKKLKKGGLFDK